MDAGNRYCHGPSGIGVVLTMEMQKVTPSGTRLSRKIYYNGASWYVWDHSNMSISRGQAPYPDYVTMTFQGIQVSGRMDAKVMLWR